MKFERYTTLKEYSTELQQGDLILDCPILIPPENLNDVAEKNVEVQLINSIVLSQSCDLLNNKIQIVLVCPFHSLKYHLSQLKDQNKRSQLKHIEEIKKGNIPGYHLLDKVIINDTEEDYVIVDFRNIYGIQIDALRKVVSKIYHRQRLLSPYREHLSQAFARYFMRVGLPDDIEVPSDYI